MNKRLYQVVITCYVMAEDERDACSVAVDNCLSTEAETWRVDGVDVDAEMWDIVPHGEAQGRTCGQILEEVTP